MKLFVGIDVSSEKLDVCFGSVAKFENQTRPL